MLWLILVMAGGMRDELADALAKEGTTPTPGVEPRFPISMGQIRLYNKDIMKKEWMHLWQTSPGLRQSKYWLKEPSKRLSQYVLKHARQYCRTAIGVLTGHNNMKYHLSNLNPGHDPLCRFCQEEAETSLHWQSQCPALSQRYLERDLMLQDDRAENPIQILEFFKDAELWELVMDQYAHIEDMEDTADTDHF